jgi:hypothetical protein
MPQAPEVDDKLTIPIVAAEEVVLVFPEMFVKLEIILLLIVAIPVVYIPLKETADDGPVPPVAL